MSVFRVSVFCAIFSLALQIVAKPTSFNVPTSYLQGFEQPSITLSSAGKAICVEGNVSVQAATAKNVHFNIDTPTDQSNLTNMLLETLQANSTYPRSSVIGFTSVNSSFVINAKLCYPRSTGINATTVQFLTHGLGFDKTYWDFRPHYSLVDVAAEAGYTTFSYDRLGVGASEHPDSISVTQAPLEATIAAVLVGMLRKGAFCSTAFEHVVGVGHSFGSSITQALTLVPDLLDAAVLTGFTVAAPGIAAFIAGVDSAIATTHHPRRFPGLDYGYMLASGVIGTQTAFFTAPYFAPKILHAANSKAQTYTLGELWTVSVINNVAVNFTGPVFIINGLHDLPFCLGNCLYPNDLTAATLAELYPHAAPGSSSWNIPEAGHGINLHYVGTNMSEAIQTFIAQHHM